MKSSINNDSIIRDAVIVSDENCRYSLTRVWDTFLPKVLFVLMKPGTADNVSEDNTVKRCIGFARRLGYGSLEIVNLFAYITSDLKEAQRKEYGVRTKNNKYILHAIGNVNDIILGWGEKAEGLKRRDEVMDLIKGKQLYCLGYNKNGEPKSPLRLRKDEPLKIFNGRN